MRTGEQIHPAPYSHEDFQAKLATFSSSMPQLTEKRMDKNTMVCTIGDDRVDDHNGHFSLPN